MKCVKDLISGFVYNQAEFFTSLVYENGMEAEFNSMKVLKIGEADSAGFTMGSLIENAMRLYVHYVESGNPLSKDAFLRIEKFIDMTGDDPLLTWGKLSVLRGLSCMHNAGVIDSLSHDHIMTLKEKTDYSDFLDKDKVELKGYATNYYHVALACAGYREKLGWETDGYSDLIKDKLISIIKSGSENGWMDEQPPYGRYDRYSLLISAELCDTLDATGKEIPDFVLSNLKAAADTVLLMSNDYGDGVLYGRSLSVHGDCAAAEVISTALKHNLIDPGDIDRAVTYTIKIIEKALNFWYSDKMKSFNLWCDGRTTNQYRHIHRILEVNLDMNLHFLSTLENFEKAGYSEYIPDYEFEDVCGWKCSEVVFSDDADSKRCLYILKHGKRMLMLPLTGGGNWTFAAAYLPFPVLAGCIEAPPETKLAFLTPEILLENGELVMPVSYFENSVFREENGTVTIEYSGKLGRKNGNIPEKTGNGFRVTCRFSEDKINVSFVISADVTEVKMIYAGDARIKSCGFDEEQHYTTENNPDYFTPHGPLNNAVLFCGCNNEFGYEISL